VRSSFPSAHVNRVRFCQHHPALVRAWWWLRTALEPIGASVNARLQNPISEPSPQLAHEQRPASDKPAGPLGFERFQQGVERRAAVRPGPGDDSLRRRLFQSTPAPRSGTTMSENRTLASAVMSLSLQSDLGDQFRRRNRTRHHAVLRVLSARIRRDRPACRMNHTGTRCGLRLRPRPIGRFGSVATAQSSGPKAAHDSAVASDGCGDGPLEGPRTSVGR